MFADLFLSLISIYGSTVEHRHYILKVKSMSLGLEVQSCGSVSYALYVYSTGIHAVHKQILSLSAVLKIHGLGTIRKNSV